MSVFPSSSAKSGVEHIIEIDLNKAEEAFRDHVGAVMTLCEACINLAPGSQVTAIRPRIGTRR